MILSPERSMCKLHQKIIVSKDYGERREHIIHNPNGVYSVRQYRLDGGIFENETMNDFLVLNDTRKVSYYIELKGANVKRAVEQLAAGYRRCRDELGGYEANFRIIASKSPTHNTRPKAYRDFLEKFGYKKVICRTARFEEDMK